MLKLFSDKKRWAILRPPDQYAGRKRELGIHRSRADGSTVGLSYFGIDGRGRWGRVYLTLDTEELMLAIMHVTHTDAQLREVINGRHTDAD